MTLKIESVNSRTPQLAHESALYTEFQGGTSIPRLIKYGTDANVRVLATEAMGASLADLFVAQGRRFSIKTVLMLADQMISCVEFVHGKGYILRDVRPANFCMGLDGRRLYIVDCGVARRFRDEGGAHIAKVRDQAFVGTSRYASAKALRGIEQSRRDDLESLAYVWLYLFSGSLPWVALEVSERCTPHSEIAAMKRSLEPEDLCGELGFPYELAQYMRIVRGVRFDERPPYAVLRLLLRTAFLREGFLHDDRYDWTDDAPPASAPACIVPEPAPGICSSFSAPIVYVEPPPEAESARPKAAVAHAKTAREISLRTAVRATALMDSAEAAPSQSLDVAKRGGVADPVADAAAEAESPLLAWTGPAKAPPHGRRLSQSRIDAMRIAAAAQARRGAPVQLDGGRVPVDFWASVTARTKPVRRRRASCGRIVG